MANKSEYGNSKTKRMEQDV